MDTTGNTNKDIRQYLHFYLGCDAFVFLDEVITDGWLKKQLKEQPNLRYSIRIEAGSLGYILYNGYKPILRPLSDMTEEEMNECWFNMEGSVEVRCEYKDGGVKRFDSTPAQVRYLLSRGFDLFGLIPAGLAIDKTKLTDHGN